MAEALFAVGVASSIIGVIDFCSKVAVQAIELARSSRDALRGNTDLERLTEEYTALCVSAESTNSQCKDSQAQKLSDECKKEASSLLDLLEQLKLGTGCRGPKRAWQSTKRAA